MKRLTVLISALMSFLFVFAQSSNQALSEVPQVCGNIYKADIGGGIASAEVHFFENGEYEMKVTYLGMSETAKGVYEQNNEKLKMTKSKGGEINTIVRGDNTFKIARGNASMAFVCVSAKSTWEYDGFLVDGHQFSGSLSTMGTLTLRFSSLGESVEVIMNTNKGQEKEIMNCVQDGKTVNLFDSLNRKITLELTPEHNLEGLFTIVNVNLKLIR